MEASAAASAAPPAAGAYPLPRERNLIIASLLALAAGAWALVAWQGATMGADAMGPTMGLAAPVFLAIWIAMMVAMMFPTATPMILTFARVQAGRAAQGRTTVHTAVFVAAYLAVWTASGAAAFALASGGQALAERSMWLMDNAGRIGGGVLVLAGAYQLTPLKRSCLSKCRSPLSWIVASWRDGAAGAVPMGLAHGVYCLGCCWLLFAILFPLGLMNIAAMALITALIFAEKSLPVGRAAGALAAVALVAYGVAAIVVPAALPTAM